MPLPEKKGKYTFENTVSLRACPVPDYAAPSRRSRRFSRLDGQVHPFSRERYVHTPDTALYRFRDYGSGHCGCAAVLI